MFQLEERIISMYMKHAKKSTQIQPVVITTVEQLPDDNAGLLSKWLTKDLVTVMDSMHGIFERADRAVVGVGTGGIAALKAGEDKHLSRSLLTWGVHRPKVTLKYK